jgi:hypothetical protein
MKSILDFIIDHKKLSSMWYGYIYEHKETGIHYKVRRAHSGGLYTLYQVNNTSETMEVSRNDDLKYFNLVGKA